MISYAGEDLILEDPDYELDTRIERSIPLSDLRLFGASSIAQAEGRWIPRGNTRYKVGIPTANWSFPSSLQVNSLWWPTGASRFAIGLFFCGKESLDAILAALDYNGGAYLNLEEVEHSDARSMSVYMHLLPPRPLSTPDVAADERLFLLPLVDTRYFWQFRDAGDLYYFLNMAGGWGWQELIDYLAGRLGESIEIDTIDDSIGSVPSASMESVTHGPDLIEFSRNYENAALLLDAAAWCVGHRIVRELDGTLRSQTPDSATTLLTEVNLPLRDGYWAGGFSGSGTPSTSPIYENARKPATVRVCFPRATYDEQGEPSVLCENGAVYAIDVAGSNYVSDATTLVSGRVKTFYDTAAAGYGAAASCLVEQAVEAPLNVGTLTSLARQIASDYYAWLEVETYDFSAVGILWWRPTGFEDAICWHWGRPQPITSEDPAGEEFGMEGGVPVAGYTRVMSLPADWGFSELLHYIAYAGSSGSSSSSGDRNRRGPTSSGARSRASWSSASAWATRRRGGGTSWERWVVASPSAI